MTSFMYKNMYIAEYLEYFNKEKFSSFLLFSRHAIE